MTSRPSAALALAIALGASSPALAKEAIAVPVRSKTVSITYYPPAAGILPRGSVIMGSGDVGWVGLGAELADFLAARGYAVAGVNVREYLETFSASGGHVTPEQVASDYQTIATTLRDRGLLPAPVVVAGVSEGAAMAVAAGASAGNHTSIQGVMTMGLPATAELAWHWKDAATWFTKRDASEPSFCPGDVIARVTPLPLWMIQSTKDEYVTPAEYTALAAAAKAPKQLQLIAASNHRFTDKMPELHDQVLAGLAWIGAPRGALQP